MKVLLNSTDVLKGDLSHSMRGGCCLLNLPWTQQCWKLLALSVVVMLSKAFEHLP